MDKRFIVLIAIFCAGSLAFFLYRKLYYEPAGIDYTIRPRDGINVGDTIVYQDRTSGATRWRWSFGDGEYSVTQSGNHVYLQPGKYNVRLSSYGSFGVLKDTSKVIDVAPAIPARASATVYEILGPRNAVVGNTVQFESSVEADSYEWRLEGGSGTEVQKGKFAAFTFRSPGKHVVSLSMRNPDSVLRKLIVIERSEAPMPAKPNKAVGRPRPKPEEDDDKPKKERGVPEKEEDEKFFPKSR